MFGGDFAMKITKVTKKYFETEPLYRFQFNKKKRKPLRGWI